jgi:UDP-2,3-diacylglucosamine hydrolase
MVGRDLNELDACEATILAYLQRHQVTQMIHGHTHQPAVHEHTLPDGQTAWRCVLDEWHAEHASVWVDDGDNFTCERIAVH